MDLHSSDRYLQWRDWKMDFLRLDDIQVEVENPEKLSESEHAKIKTILHKSNVVIYRLSHPEQMNKKVLRAMGQQLGLNHLDGNLCADGDSITSLQVIDGGQKGGYIPYSNKPLNWHTDGYYNSPELQVKSILMHCVFAAKCGGENTFIDPEIIYILLREKDPAFIHALFDTEAMTIPPNVESDGEIRSSRTGPVFSEDEHNNLHMRYTARTRSIEWKQDAVLLQALEEMRKIFESGTDYQYHYRLNPGEGVITNNAVHNREGFEDEPGGSSRRLLFRARYYDRVSGTDLADYECWS